MSQQEITLEKFSSSVLKDAQEQHDKILAEIEVYRKAEMEKAEVEAQQESSSMIQSEMSSIKNLQSRKLSLAELEGRRRLLKQREDLTEKIFGQTADKIRSYTSTPEYVQQLCSRVKSSSSSLPEGSLVIQVKPDDLSLADKLKEACGRDATVEANINIELGGYILCNNDKGIVIDETFDLKLNSQRDWFASTSGLSLGL